MLRYLKIKNLAIIEDLEFELERGFNIFTGETGAGKSIIMDGIRLIFGERADPDMVRTGEHKAEITAVIEIEDESIKKEFSSFPWENNEIILRREISVSGKGRIYFNGSPVPLSVLKSLGQRLFDIFGQNDHIFLLDINYQLDYLDSFANLIPLRDKLGKIWEKLQSLKNEREEIENKERERAQRLDFLDYQIKEIEGANLKIGEDEELEKERIKLINAEKLFTESESALEICYAGEKSISFLIKILSKKLNEFSKFEPDFSHYLKTLEEFSLTTDELGRALSGFKDGIEVNPLKLEKIEERIHTIEKLKKKWGPRIEDVLQSLESAKKEKEDLLSSEERLDGLNREIEKLEEEYNRLAQEISLKRLEKGKLLEKEIEKELSSLGMGKAKFSVKIEKLPPERRGPKGFDTCEFYISPNPGEEPKPMRKIASGGELSRIMLAIKSVGKEREGCKILIFDEIDSGIGGAIAEAVGERLKKLSKRHQVICITHLPQIASFAENHYKIYKVVEKGRTFTKMEELEWSKRVEEIARMIVGSNITETSLKNAEEILKRKLDKG
ncbi:MAG: DNA repair protein RecN [Candidatus Aminicenantia bacterium]